MLLFLPSACGIALATHTAQLPQSSSLHLYGLFFAGSFVMRGAGCIINDWWDKDLDKKVSRTKDRVLARRDVSSRVALTWLAGHLGVGAIILFSLNYTTIALGFSSLVLVGMYPLMKRITYLPQLFLGFTFNYGVLMGYSSVMNSIDAKVLPLYVACISMTMLYDTVYAFQDMKDDKVANIKSSAILIEPKHKLWLHGFNLGTLSGLVLNNYMNCLNHYAVFQFNALYLAYRINRLNIRDPTLCASFFHLFTLIQLATFLSLLQE